MEIKPIRTKRDYESALKAVEKLMHAKGGTLDGDRLDVLVTSKLTRLVISQWIFPIRSPRSGLSWSSET
jgi:antitoxin component HigA of HigAB toxin-antitoxin module